MRVMIEQLVTGLRAGTLTGDALELTQLWHAPLAAFRRGDSLPLENLLFTLVRQGVDVDDALVGLIGVLRWQRGTRAQQVAAPTGRGVRGIGNYYRG